MSPRKKKDWRTLPRKPAASKRTVQITIKVSAAEAEAIRVAAAIAGKTLVDHIADCAS